MRIGHITTTNSRPDVRTLQDNEPPAGASRALVALTPLATSRQPFESHRQAAFLAHLIATKDQLPQTRERRRAEPSEAIAAYRFARGLINRD